MSESSQEKAKENLQGQNLSNVKVLIEPASPTRKESDGEVESDEKKVAEKETQDNRVAEESVQKPEETDTSTENIKQQDIVLDEEPNTEVPSTEVDAQIVSENENNNEDSKGNEDSKEQILSDENSKDNGSENISKDNDTSKGGNTDSNNLSKNIADPSNKGNTEFDIAEESAHLKQAINEQVENDTAGKSSENVKNATEKKEHEMPATEPRDALAEGEREQPNLASENQVNPGNSEKEDVGEKADNVGKEARDKSQVESSEQHEYSECAPESKSESEKESVDMKSGESKDQEGNFQVTTDIETENMAIEKKNGEGTESSVSESERAPKTPESIANSVDLPIVVSNPSDRAKIRPVTAESEFVYNETDFPTPDYEMYGPTPINMDGQMAQRQLSPSKRDRQIASRGESTKSVTFADDVGNGSEKSDAEDEQSLETPPPAAGEGDEDAKEEAGEQKKQDEKETEEEQLSENEAGSEPGEMTEKSEDQREEEESQDIFPTAVSEEKIEEAKRKQREKDSFTRKESLAIELFGASRFEPESMEDVITKKAYEHFELGCKLGEEGEFCQAVLSFDKALNLLNKEVKFYLMRGEAYLQLCDFQSAILNLKKACVLQPDNSEYYSRLAFVYYFQGQSLFDQCLFAEALESFSRAAEMKPDVIAYHTRSIACLAALQRHGECLALVNRRLEIEKSNPDLYIMRARLHQLFRNSTLCYYDLKDALALDPEQEEARTLMKQLEVKAEENRNHAIRLQLQGKFKDSLTKITIAVEMNPSVPEYHLQRGALQRRLHDYNAAIDDFLLAMDKTEHNEHSDIYTNAQRQLLLTYNDFAVECFLGGHFEEAILLLNKALKGEKREKGLYVNRGDCFFRLQELHFALADYHQALEIDPTDPGIRSRVAAIHSQFGLQDYEEHSYQEAEARFTVAIQHNPRHGAYYIARCKVRLMMENQTGARQDFLMGLHLDPSNTDILTLMPRIYPGKSVSDVMRTKQAKEAKVAADNAVMTASPIRLPGLESGAAAGEEAEEGKGGDGAKRVTFAPTVTEGQDTAVPQLKSCMDEIEFDKILTKEKKKVSNKVKTMLHDRGTLFQKDRPKLKPQPPARPYELKGGHWKNPEPSIKPGWRTFSLGVGLME